MRAFNEVNKGILVRLLLILGLFLGHSCTTTDTPESHEAEGQTEEMAAETTQASEVGEEQPSEVAIETPEAEEAVVTPEAPLAEEMTPTFSEAPMAQEASPTPLMPTIETVDTKPEVQKAASVKTFTYKVKRKDWLSKIAKRVYHDMHKWDLIYKANPKLSNPNLILVGQKLEVPIVDASSEAFAKAYKMALHKKDQTKKESAAVIEKKTETKLASNRSPKVQIKISLAPAGVKAAKANFSVADLSKKGEVTKSRFIAAKISQPTVSLKRASFVAIADIAGQSSRCDQTKKSANLA